MPDPAIINAVRAFATVNGFPPAQLTALGFGESQFVDSDTTGDGGLARGVFQVRIDVHGEPAHRWLGLEGARAAMRLMSSRWNQARTAVPLLWDNDPVDYLSQWWPKAQGSQQPSRARCQEAVDWAMAFEKSLPVKKPAITWFPAHPENYQIGRVSKGMTPYFEGGVVHSTDGGSTIEDLGRWFGGQNIAEGMRGATHFGIGRDDGRIGQFVSLSNTPFAHGIDFSAWTPTASVITQNGTLDPNTYLIGCELLDAGTPGNHTEAQYRSLAHLFAWLAQDVFLPNADVTGFTIERGRFIGHHETGNPNRVGCPTWPEERFARLLKGMGTLVKAATAPSPFTMDGIKAALHAKVDAEQWDALTRDAARLAGLTVA